MRDKLYAYLKLQGHGVASRELVEQVLKIKGSPPAISEKLIRTAVENDRRFTLDENRNWKIAEKGGVPLSETEIVVLSLSAIDTPGKSRQIVEISAQKLKGDKTTDTFHTFVNPGTSAVEALCLPSDLVQEVHGGISPEKAVRLLLDFTNEAVLVGYHIHSSANLLNAALNTSGETIENPLLCLKYLAKKLIPDLRTTSVADIATYFKLPVVDTGRAKLELRTAVEIFFRYAELLKERGLSTADEILEFQYPDIEWVDFSKYAFDKGFLRSIPQRPGVYRMKNKGGAVIYVGKAKNLKARVSSYFWNTADRHRKIAALLDNVYAVEYEETGSELSAILLEYRQIRQYRPTLNQQLEVHERPAAYGNLKNFILLLPSLAETTLELFFIGEGQPLRRYEILRDAVNFSGIEGILDNMYYETVGANRRSPVNDKEGLQGIHAPSDENTQDDTILTDMEMREMEIILSWVDANKDYINFINMDTVGSKETCLKLIKDYLRDDETSLKKHFRM